MLLLELTVSVGLGASCSAAAEDPTATIPALIAQISSEPDRSKRYEAGDRLEKFVNDLDRNERAVLAPEVVDKIASLLGDNDEVVRAYAAGVLAQIGVPAALRAVGPLLKALREAKSDSRKIYRATDFNATDAIIGALHALKVCVVPPERRDRDVCNYLLQ